MFKIIAVSMELLISINGQSKNVEQSYQFSSAEIGNCDVIVAKSVERSKQNMLDALSTAGLKASIENIKFSGTCN